MLYEIGRRQHNCCNMFGDDSCNAGVGDYKKAS